MVKNHLVLCVALQQEIKENSLADILSHFITTTTLGIRHKFLEPMTNWETES